MSTASAVTARLMETWAHGQDIADTLSIHRAPTNRLHHIAHLGIATRGFSYTVNGRLAPTSTVRVELISATGQEWSWGPLDGVDHIAGSAEEFCLVVTRRRHVEDTKLTTRGPHAREWMMIAQTYAGDPGSGRLPGAQ